MNPISEQSEVGFISFQLAEPELLTFQTRARMRARSSRAAESTRRARRPKSARQTSQAQLKVGSTMETALIMRLDSLSGRLGPRRHALGGARLSKNRAASRGFLNSILATRG